MAALRLGSHSERREAAARRVNTCILRNTLSEPAAIAVVRHAVVKANPVDAIIGAAWKLQLAHILLQTVDAREAARSMILEDNSDLGISLCESALSSADSESIELRAEGQVMSNNAMSPVP